MVLRRYDDDVDVKIWREENRRITARLPTAALVSLIPMSTSTPPVKHRAAPHTGNGRPPLEPTATAKPTSAKPTSAERKSQSPIQAPDRQASRRGHRTRPRRPQPDTDARSEAGLGCPQQVLFSAGDVRLGPTARGDLAADRKSFGRFADDGRMDARLRLVGAIRHRARASSDCPRCPDGRARPRRLLPPGRRDSSVPPGRHRGAQRRVRRDHLAGRGRRRDAQLAQARSGCPRRAQGVRTPGDPFRRPDRSGGQRRRP